MTTSTPTVNRFAARSPRQGNDEPISRLARGVAHDINNLVTPIAGYGELLLQSLDEDSEARGDVQTIVRAAQALATLARDLQTIAGKQLAPAIPVDVNEIARSMARPSTPGVRVDLALGHDVWRVAGDATQLSHLLLQLEANAREAMPTGGTLHIETANARLTRRAARRLGLEHGDYVVLAVSDTGIGISPRVRRHLFEPYFTTKPRGKAKGLGLAFAHGIAQQTGGTVEVISRPGKGATFRVYLPRCREGVPVSGNSQGRLPSVRAA